MKRHEKPLKRTNPSGKTVWVARYTAASGERKSAGTYPTKGAAQDAINTAYDSPIDAGTTLGEYAKTWTQRHPRSARTNDTNHHRIGKILDVVVEGRRLSDWPLSELKRKHINVIADALLVDQGRAVNGARNILRALSALYENAITDEAAEVNPVKGVTIRANDPRCVKFPKAKRIFTFEQMESFATVARTAAFTNPNPRHKMGKDAPPTECRHSNLADMVELMVLMPAHSGHRLAEILATARTDLSQGMWIVQNTVHETTLMQGTKTTHGRFDIEPRRTVATKRQLELVMRIPPRIGTQLLFTTPTGCMWSERNFHTYVWAPTVRATGMDCTPQEFRASWESNLRAKAKDVPGLAEDLAAMAGHSLATANRHYVRALGQTFDVIREAIG